MRQRRIIIKDAAVMYLVFNQIKPERPDLNEFDQKQLFNLLEKAADLCQMTILAYVIYSRGYYILVKTQPNVPLSIEAMINKLSSFNSMADSASLKKILTSANSRKKPIKDFFAGRANDLNAFMRLVSFYFSHYYKKQNKLPGELWRQRFLSYVIEPNPQEIMNVLAFIFTRPVFYQTCQDPDACQLSSWKNALKNKEPQRKNWLSLTDQKKWENLKKNLIAKMNHFAEKVNRPPLQYFKSSHFSAFMEKKKKTPNILKRQASQWEANYFKLKKYLEQNPKQLWPGRSNDPALCAWISMQRSLLQRNKIGAEKKEKLLKLNFPWLKDSLPRITWYQRYLKLKAYLSELKQDKNCQPDHSLIQFIQYNRHRYKKGLLQSIQIDLLNQIHFSWLPSKNE
jgi:hypothetical protein